MVTVNVLHHISHHITVITLHVWVTMRYHCICLYTIPPTHSTFTLPPLISSPGSHLWSRSTYYITYHTTLLLSHYTFVLQWGIIVYVCVPYNLHIPPSHSLPLSHLQVLTCGHGQRTTSHITPHHCYHTTRLGNNEVSLYMSVYHTTYTFHLHTPSSYLISRFSPVVTVNVLHHISHHITVITLHVWVTMRYHCICLYTIPPTHSTFTLPPLISSPGSHLWSRSTYYIIYHTTSLLSHYTFG